MKTVTQAFKNHLAGDVHTLATLIKVVRTDGVTFGVTNHDQDITFGGLVYKSVPGAVASIMRSDADLNTDNLSIQTALHDSGFPRDDVLAQRFRGATVWVYTVNYQDVTQYAIERQAVIGDIKLGDHDIEIEILGLMEHLQYEIGDLTSPGCRASFGDTVCQASTDYFTEYGVVTKVTNRKQFQAEICERHIGSDHANGWKVPTSHWFVYGWLEWDTDITWGFNHADDGDQLNSGLGEEVLDEEYVAVDGLTTLTLAQNMPYEIKVGDKFRVTAGCDKARDTCAVKFVNILNFDGEPELPGEDKFKMVKPS